MYTKKQIQSHILAAKTLDKIKDNAFNYIKNNINKITEYDVKLFILSEFKKNNMVPDKDHPIVGVNANSAVPHYFPKKKSSIIKKNNFILIDLWGRFKKDKSVFADLTWLAFSGKNIPKNIQTTFKHITKARDLAVASIKKALKQKRYPYAKEPDIAVREYFEKHSILKYFPHKTGHSIGTTSCHGRRFILWKKSKMQITPNIPFAIEPGIYYKGKFGMRSEINCVVTKDQKLIISSRIQREMVKI